MRALVVDDSPSIRRAVCVQLESSGLQTVAVSSGEEAFSLLCTQSFDVIISDVWMPGLSGFQLCWLLRSEAALRDVPIILLTSADDPKSRFWGRHAGADAYLSKDLALSQISECVMKLIADIKPKENHDPKATQTEPMRRLSQVLDRHLFETVLQNEARGLMRYVEDVDELMNATIKLVGEVVGGAYIVFSMKNVNGERSGVIVRGPADVQNLQTLWTALEIKDPEPVYVVDQDRRLGSALVFEVGNYEERLIRVRDDELGSLRIWSGPKRIASEDIATISLLADSFAPLLKSMQLVEQTRLLASTDTLTGLPNRRYGETTLHAEYTRAVRQKDPFSVAMVDIDHFKNINDTYGHIVGDSILREVAKIIRSSMRAHDQIARWGGEEFLLIMPCTQSEQALTVTERIRAAVESFEPSTGLRNLTVSIGIATWDESYYNERMLVDGADRALYTAKRQGRNQVINYKI